MIRKCKNCQKEFTPKNPHSHNMKFCGVKCRNKFYYQSFQKDWQIKYQNKIHSDPTGKAQCLFCGKWYRSVSRHVWNKHKVLAREYKEHFDLEVKKGLDVPELKKIFAHHAIENGTWKNLISGKPFRFKKGDKVGKYHRSHITLAKIKTLYTHTRQYKNYLRNSYPQSTS